MSFSGSQDIDDFAVKFTIPLEQGIVRLKKDLAAYQPRVASRISVINAAFFKISQGVGKDFIGAASRLSYVKYAEGLGHAHALSQPQGSRINATRIEKQRAFRQAHPSRGRKAVPAYTYQNGRVAVNNITLPSAPITSTGRFTGALKQPLGLFNTRKTAGVLGEPKTMKAKASYIGYAKPGAPATNPDKGFNAAMLALGGIGILALFMLTR